MDTSPDKFKRNDIVYISENRDVRGLFPHANGFNDNNPLAIFSIINPGTKNILYDGEQTTIVAVKLIGVLKTHQSITSELNKYIGAILEINSFFLKGGGPDYWERNGKADLSEFYNLENPTDQYIGIPMNVIVDTLGYPEDGTRGIIFFDTEVAASHYGHIPKPQSKLGSGINEGNKKFSAYNFLDNYSNENSPISDTNISPSEKYKFKYEIVALLSNDEQLGDIKKVSLTEIKPTHNRSAFQDLEYDQSIETDSNKPETPPLPEGGLDEIDEKNKYFNEIIELSKDDRVHLFTYKGNSSEHILGDKLFVTNLPSEMTELEKTIRIKNLVKQLGYQYPIHDGKAFLVEEMVPKGDGRIVREYVEPDIYTLIGYDIREVLDSDFIIERDYENELEDQKIQSENQKIMEGANISQLTSGYTGDDIEADNAEDGLDEDVLALLEEIGDKKGEILQITTDEELQADILADVSIMPSYLCEKPVDLDDEVEIQNVKSEIISSLLDEFSDNKKNFQNQKILQEYLSNTVDTLIKLVINLNLKNPSSISEDILLSGKIPKGILLGAIDKMVKYTDAKNNEQLKKENRLNTNPFVHFNSATNILNKIGVKRKGKYIFSEYENEYTKNVENADRLTLSQDALLYTEFANKKNDLIKPFFDINNQDKNLDNFRPLPAQFNVNNSLYFFNSELEDRTNIFRYSGTDLGGNLNELLVSNLNDSSVKKYNFTPFHIRKILGHSYLNISIPRTPDVYDHTMYEGNPEKSWCLRTENKVLVSAENPTFNSILVSQSISEPSGRFKNVVKFNANADDIGVKIHNKNILDVYSTLNIDCIGFLMFSKWFEKTFSEYSSIISCMQVKIINKYSEEGKRLNEIYNNISIENSVNSSLESLIIKSRLLEDKNLVRVNLTETLFTIEILEETDKNILKLFNIVPQTDNDKLENRIEINIDKNPSSFSSIYYDLTTLRRLSMVLNFIDLNNIWDTLKISHKYRILLALKRYSKKNIIEENDFIFYPDSFDETNVINKCIVKSIDRNNGKVRVSNIDIGDNLEQTFYLENEFSLIKNKIQFKDYDSITVIPDEITNQMIKQDGIPQTDLYFPYFLDSVLPTNVEVLSKNAINFNGISLTRLNNLLNKYGLSESITGDEFKYIVNYILTENIRKLKESDNKIYYPSQKIVNLQPYPKYSKNKYTIPSTEYETSKIKTDKIDDDKSNENLHIFCDAFINHPLTIKAYGFYPGIVRYRDIDSNDISYLRQSGWNVNYISQIIGYASFDSIESRISWVKNQSDYGKFYYELATYYLSKQNIESTNIQELKNELENAENKLNDLSSFMRECNDGNDDTELLNVAKDIIQERKLKGRGRNFSPEILNEKFGILNEKNEKVISIEDQVAKMETVNCIQERMINQKMYIDNLKRQIYIPDFEDRIKQNLWIQNRNDRYSKHLRYPFSENTSQKPSSLREKLLNYLEYDKISSIQDENLKTMEIYNFIKEHGNLNYSDPNSYPMNKTGWIKSKIGIIQKNDKSKKPFHINLFCSHYLCLYKILSSSGKVALDLNDEMIELYGNNGLENTSDSNQDNISSFISCKNCGLPLQLNKLDDVVKSDGKLMHMNEPTTDGIAGTDSILIGKSGYDYNLLVKKRLKNSELDEIFELLVNKIISKLNLLFKPDDVYEMISQIKADLNQQTYKNNNLKNVFKNIITGTILLINLQINSELLMNMNNHYKIPIVGIFGAKTVNENSEDAKTFGTNQIDNGFLFITNLLVKIGIPEIKGNLQEKKSIIYQNIKSKYKQILETNPKFITKISEIQFSKQNRRETSKNLPFTEKSKSDCDKNYSNIMEKLGEQIKYEKMWGLPNESNFNGYSLIDGTSKICSMYSTSLYNNKEMLNEKRPIQVVGLLDDELEEKINILTRVKKLARYEKRSTVNHHLNVITDNEKRINETTQIQPIDSYKQLNSLLINSETTPEILFSSYCHKIVEDSEFTHPPLGTKHVFMHFNRFFSYQNCLELGGEYLNSICINCGFSVKKIKDNIEGNYYDDKYKNFRNLILQSDAKLPKKEEKVISEITQNLKNQKLNETTLELEIKNLLQKLNTVFTGTETIEKVNKLNMTSLKNLFFLEKWMEEKNIEFVNQFGVIGDNAGFDYEAINIQLNSMKKANVPEKIIDKQISNLTKIFSDKKKSYSQTISNGFNGDLVQEVNRYLKELLKELTAFSNNKFESIPESYSILKDRSELFRELKSSLIYDSNILSNNCLICIDPENNYHMNECKKNKDLLCSNGQIWLTLFFRQINLLITNQLEKISTRKVSVNLINIDNDVELKREFNIDTNKFTILQLKKEIASQQKTNFGNISIYLENSDISLNDDQKIPTEKINAKFNSSDEQELLPIELEDLEITESVKLRCLFVLYFIEKIINKKEWKDVTRTGIRDIRSKIFAEQRSHWDKRILKINESIEMRQVSQALSDLGLLEYDRNEKIYASIMEQQVLDNIQEESKTDEIRKKIASANNISSDDLDYSQQVDELVVENENSRIIDDYEEMEGGYDSDVLGNLFENDDYYQDDSTFE